LDFLRSHRAQVLTIDQGQVSYFLLSSSNARRLFTCNSLDFLRSGRTLVQPYCLSRIFTPPSIARWQFSPAVACPMNHRRELPRNFPSINVLVLPSEKGPRSVNSSCCNLHVRNWLSSLLSSLPQPFKYSDYVVKVHSHSFLGFWFRHFFRQVSCIACCYCTVYCSPHRRCVILNLRLCQNLMLRHDFTALNVRCGRKIFQRRAENLWLIAGSYLHLHLRMNKMKSYKLLITFILRLCHHLQKQMGRNLYTLLSPAESETVHSTPVSQKKTRRRIGGGCLSKAFAFSQISDHLVPGSTEADQLKDSMFRYVAHVDEVELFTYSSSQFVHTSVPLIKLFAFLPIRHARKIAAIHNISAGSWCTVA
jgi:hypothetical protein